MAAPSTLSTDATSNFNGTVTSVIDGDTLDMATTDGKTLTTRLALIDAPERGESGYDEAKSFITQQCLGKKSMVDPDDNQGLSFGRVVSVVYCEGVNINEAILDNGLADIYMRFCSISEFGNSDWSQKHGCNGGVRIQLDNSDISERFNGNNDDKQEERSSDCDSSYSGVCIPSPPPDLDCGDISHKNFNVRQPDPHRFDGDKNGLGCEN